MIKKIGFLFAVILGSTNAHAVMDLGVVGGIATTLQAGSTANFIFGATGSFGTGMLVPGIKLTYSTPTGATQLNALAQLKYTMNGFFLGASLGPSFTTVGSLSSTSFLFGPTVGYYTGVGIKYGIEVDYYFSSIAGTAGVLMPMAGIKFAI